MSDKDNLPYACAFIQEMFRFRTPVPLSVFHRATTDVEMNGFVIPKGTTVREMLKMCLLVFIAAYN